MKKHEIIFSLLKVPLDFIIIFASFFLSKYLREIDSTFLTIQLSPHTIDLHTIFRFAIFGAILYVAIFRIHGLYSIRMTSSKIKEIFDIIQFSIYWFLFFSFFIYFGKDFFYEKELPRLIIIFVAIIGTSGVILERIILNKIQLLLLNKGILQKRKIIIINNKEDGTIKNIIDDIDAAGVYKLIGYINKEAINSGLKYLGNKEKFHDIVSKNNIDEILYIDSNFNNDELYEIWDYSRIYGVRYRYITNTFDVTKINTTIGLIYRIPVMEIKNTALSYGGRVVKRIFDIIVSFFSIIIFLPIFIIVGILIKLEDPEGPIIYKNLRIGQKGKKFNLYKFRYLKWKYSIKESYGINNKDDKAIAFEQKLINKQSTRKGPLYKIKNDPRKTRIGDFIEKYSIDEIPQLFNVFIGNMSLVGPRPHQPREVEKYELKQKRVLTIKPGITGLSQVNGRENNKFENEVKLDIFYIENLGFLLDIKIILKTFTVLFKRK